MALASPPPPSERPSPEPAAVSDTAASKTAVSNTEASNRAIAKFSPGKGLRFTSSDGRFGLQIGLFAHALYTLEHPPGGPDATVQGLELRRARLRLKGHLFSKHNQMFAHLAFSPRDMQIKDGVPSKTPIFDWWFQFDQLRDATIRVGQFRLPWSRERRVSILELEFADRSLANFEFNLDRDVGLEVRSDDLAGLGWLRYAAEVSMGGGRDAYELDDFGLVYVIRLEALPLGFFQDYRQADIRRIRRPRLALGIAYAFSDNAKHDHGILGKTPQDGGTSDIHHVTADGVFKYAGLSINSEFFWRHAQRNPGDELTEEGELVIDLPRNGLGWNAQVGYVIPKVPLQPAIRYSGTRALGSSSMTSQDELGAALQYFFHGTALELVFDYNHRFEPDRFTTGTDTVRLQLQMSL